MARLTLGILIAIILWLIVLFAPMRPAGAQGNCPGADYWLPENIPQGWVLADFTQPQTRVILSWTAGPRIAGSYGAIIPLSVCESSSQGQSAVVLDITAYPVQTYTGSWFPPPTAEIIQPYPSVSLHGDDWLVLDQRAGFPSASRRSVWNYGNGHVAWLLEAGNYLLYLPAPYGVSIPTSSSSFFTLTRTPAYDWLWLEIKGVF